MENEVEIPHTKTEGSNHIKLKRIARQWLLLRGFKEDEIHFEYKTPTCKVDVVGISQTHGTYAIEVGDAPLSRLLSLHKHFSNVVWIPHWITVMSGDEMIESAIELRVAMRIWEEKKRLEREARAFEERSRKALDAARELLVAILTECKDEEFKGKAAAYAERIVGSSQLSEVDFRQKSTP